MMGLRGPKPLGHKTAQVRHDLRAKELLDALVLAKGKSGIPHLDRDWLVEVLEKELEKETKKKKGKK